MIGAEDIIKTMFNPDDIVCIRVFDDKKGGVFKGQKIPVEAGKLGSIIQQLKDHNDQNRGIFYVVNYGGDNDASITRINAQFMEMDEGTFEEQWAKIDKFPVPPSIVIQTQKSLHVYWLVSDAKVELFRAIQKALVAYFGGDPMCVNESRCMRLPGFYHCKTDTKVLVKCDYFHPERKYTQDELIAVLPDYKEDAVANSQPAEKPTGTATGLNMVAASCDFMQHFMNNAATLSEHDWYGGITNAAVFEGGREWIHKYSALYPGYDAAKTDAKIDHFLTSGTGPITCKTLADKGFKCPKLASGECTCKAPAAKCYVPLDINALQAILAAVPVKKSVLEDMQAAQQFVSDYLYNADVVTADSIIKYAIKDHFGFKVQDLKPLQDMYKQKSKEYQAKLAAVAQKRSARKLPPWYEMTEKGPKFLPDVLAEYCTKNMNVFYAAEQFYIYENGVYTDLNEESAKNKVREQMLLGYTKYSQITDATAQWRMQIQKDSKDLNTNPYLINVRNGMYDVLEEKLIEHSPKYLTTVQLCVSFTPGADCPRFKKFLAEQLDADQIPLVQEMLGYFLIPVQRAQKSFLIVGEAAAGKSVLLRVINELLLGRANVSNVSWQALNERFKPAELFGKLANIFADLPTKNIDDNGIFKALVGEDFLTVERKNKNPFSFQSYARLLFSCNTIPRNYGDKSEGFYRRLIIIRFKHAVPKEKRDPALVDKLAGEADGIFLFALEGLKRLMSNGFIFSETQSNLDELQKYREDSNSVLAFVKERCVLDATGEEGRTQVYDTYKDYCNECGLNPYSQRKFNEELETHFPQVARAKDTTGKRKTWRGLKLDGDSD